MFPISFLSSAHPNIEPTSTLEGSWNGICAQVAWSLAAQLVVVGLSLALRCVLHRCVCVCVCVCVHLYILCIYIRI
jgi:hypothetical protein